MAAYKIVAREQKRGDAPRPLCASFRREAQELAEVLLEVVHDGGPVSRMYDTRGHFCRVISAADSKGNEITFELCILGGDWVIHTSSGGQVRVSRGLWHIESTEGDEERALARDLARRLGCGRAVILRSAQTVEVWALGRSWH